MLFLDRCLFNPNMSAGIIAHTLEDGQAMFKRIKLAYESMPQELREVITADNDTAQMLKFSNGSSLRVGTSLRSSTFQYLHVSEFGKICAKYPDKAQEIVTGSLNTVEAGQYIFIESTAEGRSGYFYDMCKKAQEYRDSKFPLSKLDFKFFFFPWYKEPTYRLTNRLPITLEQQKYFEHMKNLEIEIDDDQKAWYVAKQNTQQEDMRREYPATPEESWAVSHEGMYYDRLMTEAKAEGRIGFVPYEDKLLVHTAWDLGYNDSNAVWFFQVYRHEIRIIDYMEGSGESLAHWIGELKRKPYTYGQHLAPHDIMVHELSTGMTRQQIGWDLGISFVPAEKVQVINGIDAVRSLFPRFFFDETKCELGIKALDNYKKEWDDRHGCWRSQPLHNWASHGADAMRTLATGFHIIQASQTKHEHNPYKYMQSRFG